MREILHWCVVEDGRQGESSCVLANTEKAIARI